VGEEDGGGGGCLEAGDLGGGVDRGVAVPDGPPEDRRDQRLVTVGRTAGAALLDEPGPQLLDDLRRDVLEVELADRLREDTQPGKVRPVGRLVGLGVDAVVRRHLLEGPALPLLRLGEASLSAGLLPLERRTPARVLVRAGLAFVVGPDGVALDRRDGHFVQAAETAGVADAPEAV